VSENSLSPSLIAERIMAEAPLAVERRFSAVFQGYKMMRSALGLLAAATFFASISAAQDHSKTVLKTERFDQDPGREVFNNRVEPTHVPTVTQDFGWTKGAIGGRVTRAARPAYYA